MAEPRGIRVGDADREAVAASLREHFAHGRLTLDEFTERLDATFAARTDLDLRQITIDLPAVPGATPSQARPGGWQQDEQQWQYGQRPWPGPRPRRGPGLGMVLLLWMTVLFFLIPGLILTRSLLPLLIILFFVFVRRLRRWRRPGPWSGPRRYRRPW